MKESVKRQINQWLAQAPLSALTHYEIGRLDLFKPSLNETQTKNLFNTAWGIALARFKEDLCADSYTPYFLVLAKSLGLNEWDLDPHFLETPELNVAVPIHKGADTMGTRTMGTTSITGTRTMGKDHFTLGIPL